jgi:hypothetical protein
MPFPAIAIPPKTRIFLTLASAILLFSLWFGVYSPSRADSCTYHEAAYEGLQIPNLTRELQRTGLIGSIHGSVPGSRMFVFTVREPDNFFKHQEFSLIAKDKKVLSVLNNLRRHDRICVQGRLISNPSPQKHILARSIQLEEKWSGGDQFPDHSPESTIPEDLPDRSPLIGKVHAISAEGRILVLEADGKIYPIYVPKATENTQGLYRGDIIQIAYKVQKNPQRPPHLQLNLDSDTPLAVLNAIAEGNGQAKTLTGKLVKFPQSPQIAFDVYAIEVETLGVNRYFTLVNFENEQEFKNIRQKLAEIWDKNAATAVTVRNMFINPQVAIEARGIINMVSPEQANPQILLKNAGDIQEKV